MRATPVVLILLLAGCAARQTVTLLPGEAGHDVGAVAVLDADGGERGLVERADSRAGLAGRGRVKPKGMAAAKVEKRYGTLVGDLPPPPLHFVLTFDIGEAQPSDDQEVALKALFAAVDARQGAEVQVVGHTDTVDSAEVNDRLSQRRANEVRAYLISRGLSEGQVRATWRGERELAVKTGDGVAEPANRRVEVIVR